jgi:hypothetical protein
MMDPIWNCYISATANHPWMNLLPLKRVGDRISNDFHQMPLPAHKQSLAAVMTRWRHHNTNLQLHSATQQDWIRNCGAECISTAFSHWSANATEHSSLVPTIDLRRQAVSVKGRAQRLGWIQLSSRCCPCSRWRAYRAFIKKVIKT